MHKLIVANWKENPTTEKDALTLFLKTASAKRGSGVEVVVCPPSLYLEPIARKFKSLRLKRNLALGAEDVFWKDAGAFTGGVGPAMLSSLGVSYVIIGHSERRKYFHETDAMIGKKIHAALAGKLKVILCVGEPLAVRKKGIAAAKNFIKKQLLKDLKGVTHHVSAVRNLIIAYEPIWAIGTGNDAAPADVEKMAKFIKNIIRRPSSSAASPAVLYGGSVTGKNIKDYIDCGDVDGALVGGASLDAKEFGRIIRAAQIK